MSECEAFRVEIEDAVDGGAMSGRAAAHVAACPACSRDLRGGEALRGLVRGMGRVDAPADFEFRLRARMAASKSGGGGGLFARLRPAGGLAWVAAAVCFLAVSATLYVRQAQFSKKTAAPAEVVSRDTAAPARQNSLGETKGAGVPTRQQSSAAAGSVNPVESNVGEKTHVASVKRAASQPRAVNAASRESRNDSAARGSIDAAFNSARVIKPKFTNNIQVGTSAAPLRVVLRDARGALVPMRSVSFGAQQVALRRETASRRPTTSDAEGVW